MHAVQRVRDITQVAGQRRGEQSGEGEAGPKGEGDRRGRRAADELDGAEGGPEAELNHLVLAHGRGRQGADGLEAGRQVAVILGDGEQV